MTDIYDGETPLTVDVDAIQRRLAVYGFDLLDLEPCDHEDADGSWHVVQLGRHFGTTMSPYEAAQMVSEECQCTLIPTPYSPIG